MLRVGWRAEAGLLFCSNVQRKPWHEHPKRAQMAREWWMVENWKQRFSWMWQKERCSRWELPMLNLFSSSTGRIPSQANCCELSTPFLFYTKPCSIIFLCNLCFYKKRCFINYFKMPLASWLSSSSHWRNKGGGNTLRISMLYGRLLMSVYCW